MGIRWSYISRLLAGCLILCLATSCHNEDPHNPDNDKNLISTLTIDFSTLNSKAGNLSVTEKIQSFRIIITSLESSSQEENPDKETSTESTEIVQLNKLVNEENLASAFSYFLLWETSKGTKNFYLFANEESVGNLSYTDGSFKETDLSALLNSYTLGADATSLKSMLSSAYFTPQYEINESGNIYLPYTAIYEGIDVKDNNESLEMYLVPVATKFIFNFINYRHSMVYVNGISINSTNTDNYLFAKVGESNLQMTLPGETSSLYWVDWLAQVSELSQSNTEFSSNQSFNNRYGWIWDYTLPTSEQNDPYVFVPPSTPLSIPGLTYPAEIENGNNSDEDSGVPGKVTAGPFYVPESKYNIFVESNESGIIRETQTYTLTIDFADSDPDNNEVPDFSDVEIDNLKALFRNTSVVINLVMRQGDIEIYSEIAPWTEQQSFGYVNEGNKPDFLKNSTGL